MAFDRKYYFYSAEHEAELKQAQMLLRQAGKIQCTECVRVLNVGAASLAKEAGGQGTGKRSIFEPEYMELLRSTLGPSCSVDAIKDHNPEG